MRLTDCAAPLDVDHKEQRADAQHVYLIAYLTFPAGESVAAQPQEVLREKEGRASRDAS